MKKIINIIVFLTIFSLTSCNESLLDIPQHGVIPEDDFYRTAENAKDAVVVVYSQWDNCADDLFFLKESLADEIYTAGSARGDSPFLDALNEFNFASNNNYIINAYSKLYNLIRYSNIIIDKFSPGTDIEIDRCIGEAKMARAWAHMELASLWGNPPIIDHELGNSSEYQQPNSTSENVWKFIIQNFDEASELLPSRKDNTDRVRMTREAALAFKGKAEVLSGNMDAAKITLKKVIDSGVFKLADSTQLENLFTKACDYNPEIIFESNEIYSQDTMWNHIRGLCAMLCWRGDKLKGIPSNLFNNGFGYCNPRQEFIDAAKAHEKGSSRYMAWFKSWDDLENMGISQLSSLYGSCGYFQYKFHFGTDEIPANGFGIVSIINWRWMRYSEVLLLYAEACAMTSDEDGSGVKALNEVQSRAGVVNTELSLQNVKDEKRFELFMEGCRFVDLVRWGDAVSTLKNQGAYVPIFKGVDDKGNYIVDTSTYTNKTFGFKENKHERLPYPEAEILSNQLIIQNPGW